MTPPLPPWRWIGFGENMMEFCRSLEIHDPLMRWGTLFSFFWLTQSSGFFFFYYNWVEGDNETQVEHIRAGIFTVRRGWHQDKDRNLLTQTFNTTWSSLDPGTVQWCRYLNTGAWKPKACGFDSNFIYHELRVDQWMSVCPVIDTHWTVHVLSVTWGTGDPNEELLNIRKWMHEGACGWPSPTFSSEQKWLLTRVGEDLRWFQLNLEPGQGCWWAKGGGLPVVWTYLVPNIPAWNLCCFTSSSHSIWIRFLWNSRVLLSCGFLLIPSAGSTSQFQARRLTDLTAIIISVLSGCSCNTMMSWRLMLLWSGPPAVSWRCSLSNLLQTTQARAPHHSSFYSYKPHRNHTIPVQPV